MKIYKLEIQYLINMHSDFNIFDSYEASNFYFNKNDVEG